LDLLGLQGGDPRPPLGPLPDGKREDVARVLHRAGFEAVETPSI